MFARFEALLKARRPRLICRTAGGKGQVEYQHTAFVSHETTPGLDADTLVELRKQLPSLPHLFAFYERYGSARLFLDSVVNSAWSIPASAYYIAPPESWAQLKADVEQWWAGFDETERQDLLPEWIGDFIAIGEVPNSGNYFLVPLCGEDTGKVFEFEHDGFEFIEQGENFEAFVEALADTSDAHMYDVGGHTRYCDGKTSHQWMPVAYECD